jgi:hypothetical protein
MPDGSGDFSSDNGCHRSLPGHLGAAAAPGWEGAAALGFLDALLRRVRRAERRALRRR